MKPSQQRQQEQNNSSVSFRRFIELVNPRYQFYPHVEKLIAVLQRVADDELHRLMVFMPPRHSKSETVSRLFSAYYVYRHPERWVGINSYGAGLAYTLSRNARNNYQSAGGQMTVEGVEHWETGGGGGMWAAGVGGPITGKGFHLGIIDDPVKNSEEAQSETIREKHKDWYKSTFSTREEPGAAIIVIQTRWHEDDLSGWLLNQEKEEDEAPEAWHIVSMEAIKGYTPPVFPVTCSVEVDDRQPGEALCPERYDLPKLRQRQRRLGSYFWSALYQQDPQPAEGEIFKRIWWRYWQPRNVKLPAVPVRLASGEVVEIEPIELPAKFDEMIQTWDCSFKDTKTSDFVAGQVWGRDRANKFLLDYRKERLDITGTMAGVRAFSKKWPDAHAKLIEDKANGTAVVQILSNDIAGLIAIDPKGGKLSRAHAVAPQVEAGNVYLPHPALFPWVDDFIGSCASFPNAAHDDDVDSFTQGLLYMAYDEDTALLSDVFRWN